jgi:AcrR family transcriptional regulator
MTKQINYSSHDRKEAILLNAEEVFGQYSYAGATIRLITKRSGVNSSLISYYFGSKEALYLNIFKLRLEEITEEIRQFERLNMEPAEKLKAYLAAYIKRVASNQSFHRLLRDELVTMQHPPIIALVSKARNLIYNFLLETIREGIAKGYFKKIDEEVFVLSILALVPSVFTDQLATPTDLNKPRQRDFTGRIVDYIISTLAAEDHDQFERKSHV